MMTYLWHSALTLIGAALTETKIVVRDSNGNNLCILKGSIAGMRRAHEQFDVKE